MTYDEIRTATAASMRCRLCGRKMLITASGLVCERGCGRLVPVRAVLETMGDTRARYTTRDDFARAWKRRLMKYGKPATTER